MTRRLVDRHPRRLLRMRPPGSRPDLRLDIALPCPPGEPEAGQRADQRALRALAEENAMLSRELGRVQARCTQWRDDCITQAERLEGQLMRARGELIARQTELAVLRETLEALKRPAAPRRARRVLCVGGRARQIPVYRALVERDGDRFTHVDGSAADCLPALRSLLADADLVILQPGFVCQGACQAVETHCARLGVRCIQLDKTCTLGFERALATA